MKNINELSIINELRDHHNREFDDMSNYIRLAETAEREGFSHVAGILRDIAHEESQHANLIAHILQEE